MNFKTTVLSVFFGRVISETVMKLLLAQIIDALLRSSNAGQWSVLIFAVRFKMDLLVLGWMVCCLIPEELSLDMSYPWKMEFLYYT